MLRGRDSSVPIERWRQNVLRACPQLEETCKAEPQKVFDYVRQNRIAMPRTALCYAIEKLPPAWRKRAMARPEG